MTPITEILEEYETENLKIWFNGGVSVETEDDSKRTPIEIAIENEENSHTIEVLLERTTNVNKKNSEGDALLHVVLKKWINSGEEKKDYYLKIAQALIAKGVDLNEPDEGGKRPLVYAIEKRNLHIIEFLRENGADFSITTEDGKPLIHLVFASICMNTGSEAEISIFELLLKHATNIHHKNCEGDTLFHTLIWKWACSPYTENEYYVKIARALIDEGADVNEPNYYGTRPLSYAVEKHHLRAVEFLRDNGADFSMRTKNGDSLMNFFIKSNDYIETADEEAEMKLCKLLISKGCQVNERDKDGTTPLHYAAMHSTAQVVEALIKHGARVHCQNNQGETPLHFATRNPKVDLVTVSFFKYKANVNAKDSNGRTPLHKIAIESRSEHSNAGLQMLLACGADVNARDSENRTALNCARSRDLDDWQSKRGAWVHEQNEARLRNAAENDDDNPPVLVTIDECPIQDMASDVVKSLTNYSISLKAADLPWDEAINGSLGHFQAHFATVNFTEAFCNLHYLTSLKDIETLKSIIIDNRTSLYDFLHMDLNRRRVYVSNVKLKEIIRNRFKLKESTIILLESTILILASYNEALNRRSLLEPAREAWLELTDIRLPAVCLDLILSFLSNSDLFGMLGC